MINHNRDPFRGMIKAPRASARGLSAEAGKGKRRR
jgi:hypothetical protein